MKKVGMISALLVTAITFTACDSGNSANTSDSLPGNPIAYRQSSSDCSSEFTRDYNGVIRSLSGVRLTALNLNGAQDKIDQFSIKYRDVSCNAALHSGSDSKLIPSTLDANELVSQWNARIAFARSRPDDAENESWSWNPVTSVPTISSGNSRDTFLTSDGFLIQVQDAAAFNLAAKIGKNAMIQNGKVVLASDGEKSSNFCTLEAMSRSPNFRAGNNIVFKYVSLTFENGAPKITAYSAQENLTLECLKTREKNEDWLISELDLVLGNLAIVTLSN